MTNSKQIRSTYVTGAFRLSYPALFEPAEQLSDSNQKVYKYSATMLYPNAQKAAELQTAGHPAARYILLDNCRGLYQEICKIARANFGPEIDVKTLKIPKFRDGNKPKVSGRVDENEHGYIVVRTTSKDRPDVTRGNKTRITDPGEVYAGCWVRAVLTVAPFVNKLSRGVTIYLIGIQKIADDSAFSSRPRAEDVFDEIISEETSNQINSSGTIDPTVQTTLQQQQPKDPWE